jgi:hypothetical protein
VRPRPRVRSWHHEWVGLSSNYPPPLSLLSASVFAKRDLPTAVPSPPSGQLVDHLPAHLVLVTDDPAHFSTFIACRRGSAVSLVTMAARSRPRGGQMKDEIDEERHLWNTIRADGRRFDQLMVSVYPLVLPREASRLLFGQPQGFDIHTFHTAQAHGTPIDTHHITLSEPNATDRKPGYYL